MVEILNGEFLGIDGKPVKLMTDGPEMSLADMIKAFMLQIPRDRITMPDCVLGSTVYTKASTTNGVIELEDAEHKWLLEQVKQHGPQFLGISAARFESDLARRPEEKEDAS